MAKLRKIQWADPEIQHMTEAEQWMVYELTRDINTMIYYSAQMTVIEVQEVLRLLLAQLEGK